LITLKVNYFIENENEKINIDNTNDNIYSNGLDKKTIFTFIKNYMQKNCKKTNIIYIDNYCQNICDQLETEDNVITT